MNRMERDVVDPIKPDLYNHYDDGTCAKHKKNNPDLFNALNNYHPRIKLTMENNPSRFLDTEIIRVGNRLETKVHIERRTSFLPKSSVPKRYKCNCVLGDLHRACRISNYFNDEIIYIRNKYKKAGYPLAFINSVIRDFNKEVDEVITPTQLFEDKKNIFFLYTILSKKRGRSNTVCCEPESVDET